MTLPPQSSLAKLTTSDGRADRFEQLTGRWLGGLAPATSRGYRTDVRHWLRWCADAGIDPRDSTGRDLTAYLASIAQLATSTRVRRLAGIRSFHTWLRDEGIAATVPELPAGTRPRVRGRDDARLVGLDAATAAQLMTAADAHSPRMAALIATQLTTGARINETLALTPARFSAGAGGRVTTTITGKGGRVRTVVVPPLALERLDQIHPDSPTGLFFVTRTGKAWTQREVRDSLTRLGRRHDLRLNPHLLRHSAASISLARGANIEAVRDMLGHASLSTTQRYVRAAATLDGSPAYSLAAAVAPG
ncbi:MAG: tyrosine-type recombinase/integrase [Brevibacterium aurantiacum]|uniref:tyrosine-type recombinase/integrase n=1 Tax=Brachybacterium TaxID=43668 RepID=UPI003FD2B4DA